MTNRAIRMMLTGFALPLALSACTNAGTPALFGKGDTTGSTEVAAAAPDSVADGVAVGFCPDVKLITNEETYRTFEGRDRSVENILYQASLYDVTRSCKIDGDQLTIDITAAGRLLAGPKGAPGGEVTMPIRVAVKAADNVPYSELETFTAKIEGEKMSDQFVYRRASVTIPATDDKRTTVLIGFDEGPPKKTQG